MNRSTTISEETSIVSHEEIQEWEDATSGSLVGDWRRWFFGGYLFAIAAFSLWTGAIHARGLDSWIIGDWLINYSGGFVRRGLDGAVVMGLHRVTGVPLEWDVFLIQVTVFLVLLGCVYQLSKGIRWSYGMTAVLLSPATLAFTVLDPNFAGLRKEILLFAALAVTIWALVCERWKDWQIGGMLALLLVGITLSHEAMLAVAAYFLGAVAIQGKSLRRAIRMCALPMALSGVALAAVMLHHGNLATARAICSSVGGQMDAPGVIRADGGVCTGSIASLQLSAAQEHAGIIGWIRTVHQGRLYCVFAIPTFVPLLLMMVRFYRRDGLRYEVGVVMACFLLSLPEMAVLMYVGADWGRWMHMQAMCLMLLAMMIARRSKAEEEAAEPVKRGAFGGRVIAALAMIVYATAWTLPAIGTGYRNQGYLSLISPQYREALQDLRGTALGRVKRAM